MDVRVEALLERHSAGLAGELLADVRASHRPAEVHFTARRCAFGCGL